MATQFLHTGVTLEQLLPGFAPLAELWEGVSPPYPSEYSARWALKRHRDALKAANGLAVHCGRLYVNRAVFMEIVRAQALASVRSASSMR